VDKYWLRLSNALLSVSAAPWKSMANQSGQMKIPATPAATFCAAFVPFPSPSSASRVVFGSDPVKIVHHLAELKRSAEEQLKTEIQPPALVAACTANVLASFFGTATFCSFT
jgi:hypothetical protein